MRRLIQNSAILLTCLALGMPQIEARGRNNANNSHNTQTEQRRPQHNNQQRPGNNQQRPGNNHQRPGNNQQRPGNNHNNPQRPNHQWNNRPQQPPHHVGNRPSQRPDFGHNNFRPGPPPPRPHMPAHRPWHRPTPPPPAWRPARAWRPFNTILGVALGSAINFTINALINNGYTVTGYGNDAVYVTNAPMLNMMWPDATLYYGNNGLYASEFVYSTSAYNLSRYNMTYNMLVHNYGRPFRTTNSGGIISSTWWGPGNQFISLSFQGGIAGNGANRFFTTLSFGN